MENLRQQSAPDEKFLAILARISVLFLAQQKKAMYNMSVKTQPTL